MADLLIRNIDESSKAALAARAVRNGRSQQAEALVILQSALAEERQSWVSLLRRASQRVEGVDLPEVERHPARSIEMEEWL